MLAWVMVLTPFLFTAVAIFASQVASHHTNTADVSKHDRESCDCERCLINCLHDEDRAFLVACGWKDQSAPTDTTTQAEFPKVSGPGQGAKAVARQADCCARCAANDDPTKLPLHPGCTCTYRVVRNPLAVAQEYAEAYGMTLRQDDSGTYRLDTAHKEN